MKVCSDIVITIRQLLFKHRILSNCKKYRKLFYLVKLGYIIGRLNNRDVAYNFRTLFNGEWDYKWISFGGCYYDRCKPLSKNY